MDEAGQQRVVVSGRSQPRGTSYDPFTHNLYFSERFPTKITKSSASRVKRQVTAGGEGSSVIMVSETCTSIIGLDILFLSVVGFFFGYVVW